MPWKRIKYFMWRVRQNYLSTTKNLCTKKIVNNFYILYVNKPTLVSITNIFLRVYVHITCKWLVLKFIFILNRFTVGPNQCHNSPFLRGSLRCKTKRYNFSIRWLWSMTWMWLPSYLQGLLIDLLQTLETKLRDLTFISNELFVSVKVIRDNLERSTLHRCMREWLHYYSYNYATRIRDLDLNINYTKK